MVIHFDFLTSRIYVKLNPSFVNRVRGLCGTFNYITDDVCRMIFPTWSTMIYFRIFLHLIIWLKLISSDLLMLIVRHPVLFLNNKQMFVRISQLYEYLFDIIDPFQNLFSRTRMNEMPEWNVPIS